jgi:hypothetical protein
MWGYSQKRAIYTLGRGPSQEPHCAGLTLDVQHQELRGINVSVKPI